MSLLSYYLIAKAIKESNSRGSSSSKSKKSEKHDSYHSSYSSRNTEPANFESICESSRFIDYIISKVQDHPVVKKFIDGVEVSKNEALLEIQGKLGSITEESSRHADEYREAIAAAKSVGFSVYDNNSNNYFYVRNENGTIKYYHVPQVVNIDGIYFPDLVSSKDENPYKTRLDNYERKNSDMVDNYTQAKTAYEKLAKRKLLLKFSESKRDELKTLQKNLSKAEHVLETDKSYNESSERYSKHAEVISRLIEADKNLAESSKQVSALRDESLLIDGYIVWGNKDKYKAYINNFMEQSMSKLSDLEVSEMQSVFDSVAEQIAEMSDEEIEEAMNSYYSDRSETSTSKAVKEDIKNIIAGKIKQKRSSLEATEKNNEEQGSQPGEE